ncbi:MAG: DUF1640 domain-containing protein [Lachnospiraceae bacterium]|nr:DUF1640 domain-containing protein [Lachnospiraceae bacterium]MBR4606960.1 DUF1640 domain-containing protein [Lachnospiraceae bacterium]
MAEKELLSAISEIMEMKIKEGIGELKVEMKNEFKALNEQVYELRSDVNTLKSDVSTLKSDVNTLKSDVSTLKSDVNTLKSEVSILKDEVSTLKSDVISLKDDNAQIWTELTSMKGQIADLRGAQAEMNAKMDLMDAEVRGMRTHLENVTDLKIKLVAENIFPATSQYISATKEIGKLREGVDVLNRVVRNHSERIRRNEERLQMA